MKSSLMWFDVPTLDFERARRFYSDVLGEEVKIMEYEGQPLGFFPMDKSGDVGGDLVPPGDLKPGPGGPRIYFDCSGRLDEALARVEPAGGKIITPKYSIPDADIAVIEDTEGNTVCLAQRRK